MDQGCGRHNSSHVPELVFLKFLRVKEKQLRCYLRHFIGLHWTVVGDCKDSVTCETSWSWVKTGSNQDAITVKQCLFARHFLCCLVCSHSLMTPAVRKVIWPFHYKHHVFCVILLFLGVPSIFTFQNDRVTHFWHCIMLHCLKKTTSESCYWILVQLLDSLNLHNSFFLRKLFVGGLSWETTQG